MAVQGPCEEPLGGAAAPQTHRLIIGGDPAPLATRLGGCTPRLPNGVFTNPGHPWKYLGGNRALSDILVYIRVRVCPGLLAIPGCALLTRYPRVSGYARATIFGSIKARAWQGNTFGKRGGWLYGDIFEEHLGGLPPLKPTALL